MVIWRSTFTIAKLKSANTCISYLNIQSCIMHMVIPYRTTKFKSANIFSMAILGPSAKFNSCQYFRLYGMLNSLLEYYFVCIACYVPWVETMEHNVHVSTTWCCISIICASRELVSKQFHMPYGAEIFSERKFSLIIIPETCTLYNN